MVHLTWSLVCFYGDVIIKTFSTFVIIRCDYYLSSGCSPSLSSIFSCPYGVSSVCIHSRLLKLRTTLNPRSRCHCCQRNYTKVFLSSEICFLTAALCWVSGLRENDARRVNKSSKCKYNKAKHGLQLHFGHEPSVTGLGEAKVCMERLLVRFSIWVLRNLRSCIRSSTCLSRAAMRSCLLSSMHWSFVMVSSTFGGRLSACEAAKDGRVKFHL